MDAAFGAADCSATGGICAGDIPHRSADSRNGGERRCPDRLDRVGGVLHTVAGESAGGQFGRRDVDGGAMHKRGGARFLLAVPNILCAFHRQSRLKGMFQLGIYINSSKRLFDSRLCQQPEAGAGPSFLWRRGAAWTAALRRVGVA